MAMAPKSWSKTGGADSGGWSFLERRTRRPWDFRSTWPRETMGKSWGNDGKTMKHLIFLGNQKTASFFAVLYFRMVYECRLIPLWNGFESGNADSTKQLRSFWAEDLTNTKISQRRTIVLWVYHEFDFGKERKGCTLKVFFKRNQQFMDIQIQICYNSSKKTVRIVFYHVLPFVMGM